METSDLIDIHGVKEEIKRGLSVAWKFVNDAKLVPYKQGDSRTHYFKKSAVQQAWSERQSKLLPTKRKRRAKPKVRANA